MAEPSQPSNNWRCTSCDRELPGNMAGMRFCPFCSSKLEDKPTPAKSIPPMPRVEEKESGAPKLEGVDHTDPTNDLAGSGVQAGPTISKDERGIQSPATRDTTIKARGSTNDEIKFPTQETTPGDVKDQGAAKLVTESDNENCDHESKNEISETERNASSQNGDVAPEQNLSQVFGNPVEEESGNITSKSKKIKNKEEDKQKEKEKKHDQQGKKGEANVKKREDTLRERKEQRKFEVKKRGEENEKKIKEKEQKRRREREEKTESKQGSKNEQNVSATNTERNPLQPKVDDDVDDKHTTNKNGVGGTSEVGGGSKSRKPQEQMQTYKKPDKADILFPGTSKEQSQKKLTECTEDQPLKQKVLTVEKTSTYDYQKHPRSNMFLPGLNAKKSIAVTFHCILPKLLWEWNEMSCMHMRFEGHNLGNWEDNVGDFIPKRQLEDDIFEMTCTLMIDVNLLNCAKGYKYVVYSPKMVQEDDCFEYLHSFAGSSYYGENPNRSLMINPSDLEGYEYHQFDYFVYPKATKLQRGVITQAWGYIMKKLFNVRQTNNEEDTFSPPTTEEMMKRCLLFYLEPYKNTLLHIIESQVHVNTLVKQIKTVFNQHKEPSVQHKKPCRVSVNIEQEFKTWLEEVVEHLQTVKNPKCQFISSVCIACCLLECNVFRLKQEAFVYPLLKMLHIQPNIETRKCPNVSYLFDMTHVNYRKRVHEAVLQLCKEAMKFKINNVNWDWLSVLPLCHFMSGCCKPFCDLEYKPEKKHFDARAKDFGYDDLRSKLGPGFVDRSYSQLEPLFIADPLLLYDFIFLCPEGDIQSLFQKIPAFLSLTWLSFKPVPLDPNKAMKWKLWLDKVKTRIVNETILELCLATVDAAISLVKHLLSKLTGKLEHHLDVLGLSISLMLSSLCKEDVLVSEKKDPAFKKVFGVCEVALLDWVKNHNVIGGSFFGGRIQNTTILYSLDELKIWQRLLSTQIVENQQIAYLWSVCVVNVVKRRVREVPNQHKIGLVYILEVKGGQDIHPLLSAVIVESAIKAIDKLSNCGRLQHEYGESYKVGELFGRMLVNKYPKLSEESFSISLDDLLQWPLWTDFIKIHSATTRATHTEVYFD